ECWSCRSVLQEALIPLIGMPSQHYQFQRLRSVVVLSGVLLAKIATSERSWGDLHIDGDRSWQTTTLPESEGEETSSPGSQGSIAYAALHARTEAFLKASRNYQVAVKGPLMDATDVYLQQKERYEHFAHNLDKGERQQHKLIHMMRSSLRKHHGHKMEEFQKTLEAERAEKKATGEDENEDEDEDEDSDEAEDSTEESGDSGSTESEGEEGREERSDESAPPADSDSKENKDEREKKSKESAAPNANSEEHHETPENANSEEHHENPEKESKAKDESEKRSKESAAPNANSEEHHETPENANSEEHHENPEKESKAKDESEKKSKESAAPNANSEEHHETPENASSEEHHENPEKESKAKEQKLSGKEADVSKGCDARRKAKQGTEEWCRCNANAELIKTRSPCEDQGGGRKNACVWSVETRSCIPRKRGKPWN
ncbi:unnamed protein product, partial [Cladocopium goreaui]